VRACPRSCQAVVLWAKRGSLQPDIQLLRAAHTRLTAHARMQDVGKPKHGRRVLFLQCNGLSPPCAEEAHAQLDAYVELGGNFVDTAEVISSRLLLLASQRSSKSRSSPSLTSDTRLSALPGTAQRGLRRQDRRDHRKLVRQAGLLAELLSH